MCRFLWQVCRDQLSKQLLRAPSSKWCAQAGCWRGGVLTQQRRQTKTAEEMAIDMKAAFDSENFYSAHAFQVTAHQRVKVFAHGVQQRWEKFQAARSGDSQCKVKFVTTVDPYIKEGGRFII